MTNSHSQFKFVTISGATFTRANSSDIDKVWNLIDTDAQWLLTENGLDHWSSYYTRDTVAKKVREQEVYLLSIKGQPVATITLSPDPADYYTPVNLGNFTAPSEKALYVSSLAVHPDFHRQGIASKLMEFADQTAVNRGIRYLRFDCRAEYTDLIRFYTNRGYLSRGSFSEGEAQNYLLIEKTLT